MRYHKESNLYWLDEEDLTPRMRQVSQEFANQVDDYFQWSEQLGWTPGLIVDGFNEIP